MTGGDLPDWLPGWGVDHLGGKPVAVLFGARSISAVFGLRLATGRDVVVKVREDDGRAASCVTAQARLADRGFPCARPITPATGVGTLAVHAEESRPGGELLRGGVRPADDRTGRRDRPAATAESPLDTVGPHGSRVVAVHRGPRSAGPGRRTRVRRRSGRTDPRTAALRRPAPRTRPRRLRSAEPPLARRPHLGRARLGQPGVAAGGRTGGSGERGLSQDRGRRFTTEEQEVAWAASLWPVAHDVRWEVLHGAPPGSHDVVRAQVAERLRRAKT